MDYRGVGLTRLGKEPTAEVSDADGASEDVEAGGLGTLEHRWLTEVQVAFGMRVVRCGRS